MQKDPRILIIGAGASGLMAAAAAAEQGAFVKVLEHMDSAGKKLLLTGKGRCNYTNTDVGPEHYHSLSSGTEKGESEAFFRSILDTFGYAECVESFRSIGIEPLIRNYRFDKSGYVYPTRGGAKEVLEKLLERAENLGVRFLYEARLTDVFLSPDGGFLVSWNRRREGHTVSEEERFDALIFAAGSNAYPSTGSDSSVYPLLKRLRLEASFTGFYPALCALYSKDPLLSEWKGRRADGTAELKMDGKPFGRIERGEIQFNEHSLSGIPVMQLSRCVSPVLRDGTKVELKITIPGKDESAPLMEHLFPIHRTAGFDRAQCCTGGIRLDRVDPRTMESYDCAGLYLCGELLDADGDCGGYNLHFAWATGYIAGRQAALHARIRK